MLIYTIIWLFSVIQTTYHALIQESYNIKLEDNGNYKINEFINEEDYEMIKDNDIKEFHIEDKENKLQDLHRLVM